MIIELITSTTSLIIGFFTNRLLAHHSEKYTRKSERFEKLYAPFVKMVWLHTHGAFQFSDLAPDLQRRFKWVYDVSAAKDIEEADKCFFLIEQRISLVFNVLCRKLFFEPYSIKHADRIAKKWDNLP